MNKANECTCPSGDGSLVHPCPAHPAVEQVGGDERAAFEAAFAAMGRPVCRADYDQDAYGTPFDDGGWTGWQARAALAQPSPVQAEVERPEVVARVDGTDEDWFIQPEDETELHNEGLLFAGCELGRMIDFDRIVGALRAENAKLSEALDECDGDRWKLRSERDAANARLHEVATACATAEQERDSALARVAELEKELAMARDAASKGDAARHAAGGMEMEIQELREKVTELQKKLRSRWTYASTQATNCAGCGEHKHTPLRVDWMGGYVCLTCIDKKLEELHDAQTQHSVPEEFSFEYRHPNGESHTVTVSRDQVINEMPDFLFEALCSKFCNCEPVGETNVVECCCDEYAEEFKLLAAAPGKEVGHE